MSVGSDPVSSRALTDQAAAGRASAERNISPRRARRNPRPGPSNDSASSTLVLPVPLAPQEHHRLRPEIETQKAVTAEIAQREPGNAGPTQRRCEVRAHPEDRIQYRKLRPSLRACQTRIGINT